MRLVFIALFAATLLASSSLAHAQTSGWGAQPDPVWTEAVTFSKLIFRPRTSFGITVLHDEIGVAIIEYLRKTGINAKGAENLLFNVNEAAKARYVLGGTVTYAQCTDPGKESGWAACDIAIEWEIFDTRSETIRYKTTTRARQKHSKKRDFDRNDMHILVLAAVRSLVGKPRFKEALKKTADVPSGAKYPLKEYARCFERTLSLPKDLPQITESVVVVKVGGVHGSGFFISGDGLILTAEHVVSGAGTVVVKMSSGIELPAKVLRTDKEADIAVLKVGGKGYACLEMSSALPTVGSEMYAVGSPFEEKLASSVSKGIVSGIRMENGKSFIQTDASVSPGNSGGPLVGKNGEVYGILSKKIVVTGIEGLGFAVPGGSALLSVGLRAGGATTLKEEDAGPGIVDTSFRTIIDPSDPHLPSPFREFSKHQRELEDMAIEKEKEERPIRRAKSGGIVLMVVGSVPLVLGGSLLVSNSAKENNKVLASGIILGIVGLAATGSGTGLLIKSKADKNRLEEKRKTQMYAAPTFDGSGAGIVGGVTF